MRYNATFPPQRSEDGPVPAVTKQLDRKLGFLSVYSIAVGAMLGSGIFVLPGLAAAIAGPWVALSYLLAGVLVLPAVLSKAELATAMPVAGGSFVYVDRSMGPWLGTIAGIGTWFALSAKTAFALVGLGAYLVIFTSVPTLPVSLGILALLLGVNYLGAGKVSGFQIAVVAVTLVALIGFASIAGPATHPDFYEPAFPAGAGGIIAGAGFVFVSYNGVTKICSVAEEIRRPERNIPLGMLAAQATVMVLYAGISWVCVGHITPETLSAEITPVATAAGKAMGSTGRTVMAVIAIIGLISMCNAGILATSRFPFAMGRARVFPRVFERVDKRFGTPHLSLLATGALLVALVAFLPVQKLAKLASGFTIFIFCIVNAAVLVLRETGPRWYAPTFRSPLYPWTQIAGVVGGLALLVGLGQLAMISVVGGFALGTVWYFAYAKNRIDRRGALQHLATKQISEEFQSVRTTERMERENREHEGGPRVVVPIFGSEPAAERLVRLGSAFAEDAVLDVVRYEEVSEQTPLSAALTDDEQAEHLAEESALVAAQQRIRVAFHDVVTHNAKEAAHRHALETDAEWLVLELPAANGLGGLVRYPTARWVAQAPCDQAIFYDRLGPYDGDTSDDYPRILVLAEPGPHDSLLLHVADRLALTQQESSITMLSVLQTGPGQASESELEAYHAQLAKLCETKEVHSKVVRGASRRDAIVQASGDYDILVIEGPPDVGWRTVFFGSEQHTLEERAQCSVLTVKAPRHKVHARVALDAFPLDREAVASMAAAAQVNVGDPASLFRRVAAELTGPTGVPAADIVAAMRAREAVQTIALPGGFAVAGIVLPMEEQRPVVVVLTTMRAVSFGGRWKDDHDVDVVMVVAAPPGARAAQIALLATLAHIAGDSVAIESIRAQQDGEGLRQTLLAELERLDFG